MSALALASLTRPAVEVSTVRPIHWAAPVLQRCGCGGTAESGGGACEECARKRLELDRAAFSAAAPSTAPTIVNDVLRESGRALDDETATDMQDRFGHDFSRVRVHTDARAAESARAVNARAYTVGSDVVFGSGEYAPRTQGGTHLLAHELTHVVQQDGVSAPSIATQLEISRPSDAAEREAERVASDVVSGQPTHVDEHPEADLHPFTLGAGIGAGAGALGGALIGGLFGGPLGALIGAGVGALVGGIAGYLITRLEDPLDDMSTYQSPGGSGWWGATFGCYRNNCTKRHEGWDIHAPVGTQVKAVTAGTMRHHENPGGWGHTAILKSQSDPNREFIYGHLSAREPAGVFKPGAVLGRTGASGNAQANRPHLHLEVRDNNVPKDPDWYFKEPDNVVEQLGTPKKSIGWFESAPCKPCAM